MLDLVISGGERYLLWGCCCSAHLFMLFLSSSHNSLATNTSQGLLSVHLSFSHENISIAWQLLETRHNICLKSYVILVMSLTLSPHGIGDLRLSGGLSLNWSVLSCKLSRERNIHNLPLQPCSDIRLVGCATFFLFPSVSIPCFSLTNSPPSSLGINFIFLFFFNKFSLERTVNFVNTAAHYFVYLPIILLPPITIKILNVFQRKKVK